MIQRYLIRNGQEQFVREIEINAITESVPDDIFKVGKTIEIYQKDKVYAKDFTKDGVAVEIVRR